MGTHLCRALLMSATISLAPPASGAMLDSAVLEALRCVSPPSPLSILEALENAGKISAEAMVGIDSMSCFPIEGGLEVFGAYFTSVCAHEEDGIIRATRPDLLWRGPGTSPGQMIMFGSTMSRNELVQWYVENIGDVHVDRAVTEDGTGLLAKRQVECNSYFSR